MYLSWGALDLSARKICGRMTEGTHIQCCQGLRCSPKRKDPVTQDAADPTLHISIRVSSNSNLQSHALQGSWAARSLSARVASGAFVCPEQL